MAQKQIYIAVLGATGGVGTAFLNQLEALAHRYLSTAAAAPKLHLIYAARSSKALLAPFHEPIAFAGLSAAISSSSTPPLPLAQLAEHLSQAPGPVILADNTSNEDVAAAYPALLSKRISIVTPNKKAFSSSLGLWNNIFAAAANGTGPANAGYIFHESSVGAGLPVLNTLKDLVETGDLVTKIEGVFSGTMSFLFNGFMPVAGGGGSFSAAVKDAKERGYTEPDPRDDLNGLDVARKCAILARLAGLKVEGPTSFPVQSLIPKQLESCQSGDEFLAKLGEYDGEIEAVKQEAEKEGKVLRFVGSVDVSAGQAEVGLKKFDKAHPIAQLKGSDNIFTFYTKRYGASPLVIQGAGAGAEVTAMGVIADLIRVVNVVQ